MSYCRWSSEDFSCDVYAYESESGYVINVASGRYIGDIPKIPSYSDSPDARFNAHKNQMKFLETAKSEPIGKEYDGKEFVYDTIEEFLIGMLDIKSKGYNVPDWAIASIRAEIECKGEE